MIDFKDLSLLADGPDAAGLNPPVAGYISAPPAGGCGVVPKGLNETLQRAEPGAIRPTAKGELAQLRVYVGAFVLARSGRHIDSVSPQVRKEVAFPDRRRIGSSP